MPRQVDHDRRRSELTDALLRIAATRGLQAVTMREVAAEAGVSLRVVQYYVTDKATLLSAGLAELAARLDRRVKARAAAAGPGLTARQVFGVVLGAIVPDDDEARADALAWAAFYAVALTDPGLGADGRNHPDALEAWLTARLVRAQAEGEAPAGLDARREVVLLLALANGLTSSVLGRQRSAEDALAVLEHQLDRVLGSS